MACLIKLIMHSLVLTLHCDFNVSVCLCVCYYRFLKKYNIKIETILNLIYTIKNEEPCFKIKCGGVSCIFEFQAYHFIAETDTPGLHLPGTESQAFSPTNTTTRSDNVPENIQNNEWSPHLMGNGRQ